MLEVLLGRRDVVIVDTETTGFGATDQVIQVAVINTRGKVLMNDLVRVTDKIPKRATKIHGWTRWKLRRHGARQWVKVYPKLKRRLHRATVVLAWNAPFDKRLIAQTCNRNDLPSPRCKWQCCMRMYKQLRRGRRYGLKDAAQLEGVRVGKRHDALADCRTTLAVMQAVANSGDEGKQVTSRSGHKRGCLGFGFRKPRKS